MATRLSLPPGLAPTDPPVREGQAAPPTRPIHPTYPPAPPTMTELYSQWYELWRHFKAVSGRIIFPPHMARDVIVADGILSYISLSLCEAAKREQHAHPPPAPAQPAAPAPELGLGWGEC